VDVATVAVFAVCFVLSLALNIKDFRSARKGAGKPE
jgi:hypothetical protein